MRISDWSSDVCSSDLYPGRRHCKLAAAVEFIHTATLLHDDVVDGSDLRRGRKTANLIWGNSASVLVGDFLFARSFELMVEDGSLKVLKIRSEEHTSELQSLMRISYAVFCLKKKTNINTN